MQYTGLQTLVAPGFDNIFEFVNGKLFEVY